MKRLIVAALVITLALTACSKNQNVAKVGDQSISKTQFEAYLAFKNIPRDDSERTARALDFYLERAALAAAIEKSQKLNMALVEAELQELKVQMLLSRYFESYLKEKISEEGIQNYYSHNAEKYQSEQVHVAHILFRVKPEMDEAKRQTLLTSAHEAYSKIQSNVPFEEVAKAYSEDKVSAANGGDLGWIVKDAVSPEFSEKAFATAVGTASEPFLSAFGFHILKVLEAPQVIKKPLEAVKGDIRYQLRNEAKSAEIERLTQSVPIKKGA